MKNSKPKIILMGNKNLAVECLNYLVDHQENIVGVICNFDDDENSKSWYKSLKREAKRLKIRTWQPKTCNEPLFIEEIRKTKPDLIFSLSYNRIIKRDFMDIPTIGIFNFHFAKLPHHRGCLPVVYALASGDLEIGVTLHQIDPGIDTGPIIDQGLIKIKDNDTAYSLYFKCVDLAKDIFSQNFLKIKSGKFKTTSQNEKQSSYHQQIYPQDRWINWFKSAQEIDRLVRALTFSDYPSARTVIKNQEIEILHPVKIKKKSQDLPGIISNIKFHGLEINAGKDILIANHFRIEEKKYSATQLVKKLNLKNQDVFQNQLKILHVGNIANNAYLNTKFLREKGVKSDVILYDYYHIMSTPEWEDANFSGDYGNDFAPDWSKVNLHGFKRPDWFMQGALEQIAFKKYNWKLRPKKDSSLFFIKLIDILIDVRIALHRFTLKHQKFFSRKIILGLSQIPFFCVALLIRYFFWAEKQLTPKDERETFTPEDYEYWQNLIEEFKRLFPERKDKLKFSDIRFFLYRTEIFQHIFKHYDLVQCYATDPIYAMLANKHPYIAFEHGTIRDIPFENSLVGRLTALAYKKADLVFITNLDNTKAAQKLGLKNYVGIPHPINNKWHLFETNGSKETKEKILFCPSRHDWPVKGVNLLIEALPEILKIFPNLKVFFVDWGQDTQKSKNLIKKLEIEKNCHWLSPLPKHLLISWMKKSDVVFDQIYINAMGAITPEAMQEGKPVLMSYRQSTCSWFFKEEPPIIKVYNRDDIIQNITKMFRHPAILKTIGKKEKIWFDKFHSKKQVTQILINQYRKLLIK